MRTQTKQRVAFVSLTLLCTAVVYVVVNVLASIAGWAMARADTGTTLDVPSAIQKYGWWGGALIVYVAARWFVRRNATEHWIAHGRWLSLVTAALSIVGSVVGWRLGMDPDTIGFAIAGAVPLAIPSTVKASASTEPPGETR